MTLHLQIRPATVRDIQRILPLWEALAALHGELDPALAVEPEATREYVEFLRDAVGRSDTCVMLAIDGDSPIAFALGRIQVLPLPFREQRGGDGSRTCSPPRPGGGRGSGGGWWRRSWHGSPTGGSRWSN